MVYRIAIVGGGSVGISFLYQFLRLLQRREHRSRFAIAIVDPSNRSGSGQPYQSGDKTSLLNTRTGTTSALYDDRSHFHAWVIRHRSILENIYDDLDVSPDGFLPRSVFGLYLESLYVDACEMSQALGVTLHRIYREVVNVAISGAGEVTVDTDDGAVLVADQVILCTGNPPSRLFDNLRGTPGYVHTPYPADRQLAHIPASAKVCVIGSGLTATDVVIALARHNGARNIVCVSKNGRVQGVKSVTNQQMALKFITPQRLAEHVRRAGARLSLQELAQWFVMEVEHFTGAPFRLDDVLHPDLSPLDYLTKDLQDAENGEKKWQFVIYALNDIVEEVWRHLSDEGRSEFMEQYRTDFMSYKVAIPPGNARILQKLLRDRILTVLTSTGPVTYREEESCYAYSAKDTLTGKEVELQADFVVNATGFSTCYADPPDRVTRGLIEQGLAAPHPHGGLHVDFRTSNLIDRKGRMVEQISCLGTLTCGAYFWTAAMDVNSKIAFHLARRMLDEQEGRLQ